jgi:GNAT superfamily N-acetyltransferase
MAEEGNTSVFPTPRRAQPSERLQLKRFVLALHLDITGYCPDVLKNQISDLPADFPGLLSDDNFASCQYWVVDGVGDGKLAGCIGVKPADDPSRGKAYIESLFVRPESRGRGYASALLRHALGELARSGHIRARLCTLRGVYGAACRLYESFGFHIAETMRTPDGAFDLRYYEHHRLQECFAAEAVSSTAAAAAAADTAASRPELDAHCGGHSGGPLESPLTTAAAVASGSTEEDNEAASAPLIAWRAAGPPPYDWPGRAADIAAACS